MNNKLDTNLLHPRDQIALVISRIYNRGLTTTSGGNISVAEFSARSIIMGNSLGEMVPINDEQVEELRRAFLKGLSFLVLFQSESNQYRIAYL